MGYNVERCDKHQRAYRKQLVREEEERQRRFLRENGITWKQHLFHLFKKEEEKQALEEEAQCRVTHGMSRQEYREAQDRRIREEKQAWDEREARKCAETQARMREDPQFVVRELEKFCTQALLPEKGVLGEYLECVQGLYQFEQDPEDENVLVLKDGRRLRVTVKVVEDRGTSGGEK